ncbi:hypothetical protein GCM10027589_15460 [Actinocorallia lasiicapitis]
MVRTVALVLLFPLLAACSGEAPKTAAPEQRSTATPGELQGRWWNWALASPARTSPLTDKTGAHCAVGQPGDIWFLAGALDGKVERTCAVPAGRPLFAPLLNLFSESEQDCTDFMRAAKGTATLDGSPITPVTITPTPFTVTPVKDNPVSWDPGTYQVYGCGLYAQLPALPSGSHILKLTAGSGSYSTSVTYTLTTN